MEVDETYFGASFKNRRRAERGRASRPYLAYISTRIDWFIQPVATVNKDTLQDIIQDKVSIETTIYSDTGKAYQGLDNEFAEHKTLNHSDNKYV